MSKELEQKLEATQQELGKVKLVLGTLISWLQMELGRDNTERLIEDLERTPCNDEFVAPESVDE